MTRVSQAQAAARDKITDIPVGDIPDFDYLIDWYTKNCPAGSENGIVHGDFKCDNMVSFRFDSRIPSELTSLITYYFRSSIRPSLKLLEYLIGNSQHLYVFCLFLFGSFDFRKSLTSWQYFSGTPLLRSCQSSTALLHSFLGRSEQRKPFDRLEVR